MPAPRSADAEVYAALGAALGAAGLRWYLFGGQAAILHGSVRFTEDVDVTVELGTLSHGALLAELQRHGFVSRVDDPAFIEATRVLPLFHEPTRTPVDLTFAGPGLEQLFLEQATTLDIEDCRVPVARAEHILVMKVLAGRPKDIEDVLAILTARGASLDLNVARDLLRALEEALGEDLVSVFEQCVARVSVR